MTILPYQNGGYIRFISDRTGETLFEIKMLDGAMIVWGTHYRPDEFSARLTDDSRTIAVVGTLHDRVGPVVTFGDRLDVACGFRVALGSLPANFDPAWSRDCT